MVISLMAFFGLAAGLLMASATTLVIIINSPSTKKTSNPIEPELRIQTTIKDGVITSDTTYVYTFEP